MIAEPASAPLPRLGGQSLAIVAAARLLGARRAAPLPVLIAALIGISAVVSGFATPLDQGLRALREAVRDHPASGDIHLVEIDARSLAAIDRWPWTRGYQARAVDALHDAGARTIAFDVDFSARSDTAEDAKFAAALRRAEGRVILPTFRQAESGTSGASIDNLPIAALREASFLAAVTIVPDSDGLVRSAPVAVETAGSARPSLGAMLAETQGGTQSFFPIDYAIDPATIPRHSFVDLIEGRIDPARLRGKRVLIGATAIEMGDRYAVPRFGVVPGAVIQALAGETLLAGPVPRQAGPLLPCAIALLALIALAFRRRGGRAAVAGAAAVLLLGPILSQSLWSVDFAIAPALLMLATGALVAAGCALLAAFAARSLTQAATGLPNLLAFAVECGRGEASLVAVGRLANTETLAAALGADAMADLCRGVADRLAWSSAGAAIHHVDEASFAWIVAPDDEAAMCDRFDALAAMLRAPIEVAGRRVDVSVAFGLASAEGPRQAVANAALAAAQAHESGARWQRFVASEAEEAEWRLGMLGELDAAIEDGDLHVLYQPKRDLRSGSIDSAEALVRWQHRTRGLIPPDSFIAFAEAGGRIEQLTAFVLDTALRDAAAAPGLGVAVNISASLLASHDIVGIVRDALAGTGIAPGRVTLEVTESAAMHRTDTAVAVLAELRLLGVRISIDDYGTGQSTLSYLKRLPASELKIDKSFVQAMLDNRSDAILVASTINLAQELGLDIVAEGVETQDCLDRLREMGCTYAQGYLVGRPMPIAALLAMRDGDRPALAA